MTDLSTLAEGIIEALQDPIVLVNAAREVAGANAAARGFFSDGLIGRDIALSIRHPDVLEALETVLAGTSERDLEITLQGRISTTYNVRVRGVTLPGESPDRHAVISFHDVTGAKQVERMRADFVANVSHELRSPLTSLLGFIETIRGPARDDSAAQSRFLEVMDAEAKRMTRLIDDLLSLSRVEIDEHLPPTGRLNIARVLEEIAGSLSMRAAERDKRIEISCEDGLPDVMGDQDELTLVFRNLIDNSINYSRANTPITVSAQVVDRVPEHGGPGIAVAVRDQGEGIEQEHIPRLTERFYRVDKGRSRSMGGTGLGLAIVKHIVSHHRGQLTIESTPGEGSVFTVYLPSDSHA